MDKLQSIQTYFSQPGPMTTLGDEAGLVKELPADPNQLVKIVQGLVVHIFWAERYGLKVPKERAEAEVNLRQVRKQLARILELDPQPLAQPRPLEKRLVGNCRDFSTLTTALLRGQGIPARARCGFGTYFRPGHFEDHWVVEYWHAGQERWVMVDAQLDEFQCIGLNIQFDPLDMPKGQFVLGGEAWRMCRQGQANPDDFGIFEWRGWDFVRGNLFREVASLNKIEMLPWDQWGGMERSTKNYTPAEMELMDQAAELTAQASPDVIGLYQSNPTFHVPPEFWA